MEVKKLSKYACTLVLGLILTACSSYNAHQGANDFFDGAITNATENQRKADTGVGNVEPSATADAAAGILNVGFNWLWSLFQPKQE